MAHDELIKEFNELADEYAKHRDYIDKAQAQAAKFSAAVIEKVVLDHEIKSSGTADLILPHVPTLQAGIADVDTEKAQINTEKASSDDKMEELQLRAAIGELEDAEFEELSKELKETLDKAANRIAELDDVRDTLQAALDRWVELAARAGQDDGLAKPEPDDEATRDGEELLVMGDEPVVVAASGQHSSSGSQREDVSAVFGENPAAEAQQAVAAGEESLIEVGDISEDDGDEASADVDFGFDDGDDFLAEDNGAEVQLDLVDENSGQNNQIAVSLGEGDAMVDDIGSDGQDDARRALLLYQEGTAEEQIYPFTGDVLTIGRGRDNDIQIKNDSKVSRFHCRLFRRTGNFYIEDNKSSNGTLVNGELITERRLFGGEEVIIGETFFRFRIM
ncbi:MAG: FHA domain-containing protein [Oligoflexia bacterium]|nr:FHA domain-containing protein [Oligoflexia bacterium]